MRDYRKLDVWRIAREIAKDIYLISGKFPKSELYGLTSQMRRAAVSVISNIAEGCRCDSNKEFIHFLRISMGSIKELESQFYVAVDVGFLEKKDTDLIMERLDSLGRKLFAYIKYLRDSKK